MALIAPVLFILLLAAIDYGRVYFSYVSVTNAARNGADYAAQNSTQAADLPGITAAALGDTQELLNTTATNPNITSTTGTDGQGKMYARVTVTYTFNTIFSWPGLPDSVNVQRTVQTRVAQ